MAQDSDHRHCAEEVRTADRERWLLAALAPAPLRGRLLALYAFYLELARTPEQVSEPALGRIRLQWWREAIEAAASGAPPDQPLARALADLIEGARIRPAALTALVDAFEDELESEPLKTIEDYVERCRATGGALARLACEALAITEAATSDAAAMAGTAHAMARRLGATAALAARGRIELPRALLAEHGVDPRSLLAGRPDAGLKEVAKAVAAEARTMTAAARAERHDTRKGALAALTLARIADLNLSAIARADYALYAPDLAPSPMALPLAIAWTRLTGRY